MNTEQYCANCTKGHKHLGNIQRPIIKIVYVNGIENTDIKMSEIERFIKNFQISDEIRSPFKSTIIVIIFIIKETAAVVEYSIIRKTCQLLDRASRVVTLISEILVELLLANSDNQIGSIGSVK